MNADALAMAVPPPFFRDHRVNQRPVLPAVEAMEWLAADARRRFPGIDGRWLRDLRFDKFLYLDSPEAVEILHSTASVDDGSLRSALVTRRRVAAHAMARRLTHACLTLDRQPAETAPLPLEQAAALAGPCVAVRPERIYGEMVPFGPAYRNIREPLLLSADGALARVASPRPVDPRIDLHLGSPYVLDAAFHAACVWGQRFCGVVAFPVALDRRTVIHPTRLDTAYTARVVPVATRQAPLVFDILIYDDEGRLQEAATGVRMRDVSGGRMRPPEGFHQPPADDPLEPLRRRVAGMVVVERRAVARFATAALTDGEKRRLAAMTGSRRQGYLSARLALKRLTRRLAGGPDDRPAQVIETVAQGRPQCPLADGSRPFCTLAHDGRFTVAAASHRPLGVDVEPLDAQPTAAMHLFMEKEERRLVERSQGEYPEAILRVWSVKEAVTKALGIHLVDAWHRVRVTGLAATHSHLEIVGAGAHTALHATLEGHLFTLVRLDAAP